MRWNMRWAAVIVAAAAVGGAEARGQYVVGPGQVVARPGVRYGYYRPATRVYATPRPYYSYRPIRQGFAPGSIHYQADSPFNRDYSTARDLPYSKPWMLPPR